MLERLVDSSRCALRTMTVLVVLLVTGCAGAQHWSKPGATVADFNRDSYDCARQHAETGASFRPFQGFKQGTEVDTSTAPACRRTGPCGPTAGRGSGFETSLGSRRQHDTDTVASPTSYEG